MVKIIIPSNADRPRSLIAPRLFLWTFLYINRSEDKITRRVKLLISNSNSPNKELPLKNITLINKTKAVERIKAKTIGLTPFNAP